MIHPTDPGPPNAADSNVVQAAQRGERRFTSYRSSPREREFPQRHRTRTVLTENGPVEIDVPRDTGSTSDPQIVRKRQRRLTGVDEIVMSLSAKGLTTGEIEAHFAEVFGARVSKDTISRITEKVIAEMRVAEPDP
jgi:transposase-like protein